MLKGCRCCGSWTRDTAHGKALQNRLHQPRTAHLHHHDITIPLVRLSELPTLSGGRHKAEEHKEVTCDDDETAGD